MPAVAAVGVGGQKVKVMRAALHAELNGLIADLARGPAGK
jgi:hypothetical protein